MNKKKLSVVMAGAMLVSSVAPVLAADLEKSEYSAAQLGLLKKELRELLESKKFHSTDKNLAGQSVYYVTKGLTGNKVNTVAGLDTFISNLNAGDKVYVWSEGFRTDDKGNYFSTTKTEDSVYRKYTASDLVESDGTTDSTYLMNQIKKECWQKVDGNYNEAAKFLVKDYKYIEADKSAVIELNNNRVITLTEGAEELDFSKPVDADGYEVKFNKGDLTNENSAKKYKDLSDELKNKVDSIVGFAPRTVKGEDGKDIVSEKLKEITITTGGNDLTVEDLYDGLMLTTEGHDLLNEIKYYTKVSSGSVKVTEPEKIKGTDKYGFTITFSNVASLSAKTINVTGTDSKNINRLQNWLKAKKAKVDILAGANRYETAVNIAKEQVFEGIKAGQATQDSNIVLVNGDSLVDGLSAAPLAAKLGMQPGNQSVAAPILLTEADSLPKATKAYLKELLANKTISDLRTTIHLVGGETVLTKSLERELKDLGFKVERYGGDNREETSLEVAEAMGTTSEAFVVGAEGEADAMSIAAVAADNSTPIIVSKKGGLTEDAIDALKDVNVTIIGGENAVSKADYEAVKAEANSLNRIAGANRKATNALIIEKYYGNGITGVDNVIVAKDGQKNKAELVDALAAANLASQKKAPIVLATDKLSDAQINALELKAKDSDTLYQVGNGVARDVVKTIAQRLGLAN